MTARLHPHDDLLIDYASGGLSPALCITVSAHLHFCERCRSRSDDLLAIGGALLLEVPPVQMRTTALQEVLARLDSEMSPEHVSKTANSSWKDVPAFVQKLIPSSGLRWQFQAPSIRIARIPTGDDRFELGLQRIKPGGSVPHHDHQGLEVTVVLEGGFSDENGSYHDGDFLVQEPGDLHALYEDQNLDCYCLLVQEKPIRLTGLLHRLLNPFMSVDPG